MEKACLVNYCNNVSDRSAIIKRQPRNGNGHSVDMLNRYSTCCDNPDVYKLYIRNVSHLL